MFGTDEEGEIKVCFVCSYNCRVCTKDKNVGYVLERLIGAMTVQQKMDEIKEAISPMKEEEEEDLYVQPDLGKGLSGVLNLLRSQKSEDIEEEAYGRRNDRVIRDNESKGKE